MRVGGRPRQQAAARSKSCVSGRAPSRLFADDVRDAQASANLYSLIETAKANGLEPYAYLRLVFTELPRATTLEHIEALLPWNADRAKMQAGSAP